jgi:hypothetical protein
VRTSRLDDALFARLARALFFTLVLIAIRAFEEPHLRKRFGAD